jgi:hypothetical protein
VKFHIDRILLWLVSAALILAGCTSPSGAVTPTPTPKPLPALPTPDVPSQAEIDSAAPRWQDSQTRRYYAEVQENSSQSQVTIRLVVADDQIRAAQKLTKTADERDWSAPAALPLEEARTYTVDALLARLRRDASGSGPAPYNLRVAFDQGLGYPAAIHAEALPVANPDGSLTLDRRLSYDLSVKIKTLLEDTFAASQQPILTLTRSGGAQAWCDHLRVFVDGSSVYADDCRQTLWQLRLPTKRLEQLKALAQGFASLDALQEVDGGSQRLWIRGSGEGSPDTQTLAEAWEAAKTAHQLLSRAVGLGLNLLYVQAGRLYGFDVFNAQAQPTTLNTQGQLRGAAPSPDHQYLSYSDDAGLHLMNLVSAEVTQLLPPPPGGYYLPRAWGQAGQLLVALITDGETAPLLGWVSLDDRTWHNLPLPEGLAGYGCDTGAAWSPAGPQLAITGSGYGEPCNQNPGLTLIDLSQNSAHRSVSALLNPGSSGSAEGDTPQAAAARHPDWSPDGGWIAFSLDQDSHDQPTYPARLYRARPDGSSLTPLSNNSTGVADFPTFAPDGTLYYALNGVSVEADGIYQYTPADNKHTRLISGASLRPLDVSPDGEFLLYAQGEALNIWGFISQEALLVVNPPADQPVTFSGWLQVGK